MRLFPLVCLVALAGCRSGPLMNSMPNGITPGPSTTLHFNAATIDLTRFPSTCGVTNPPYTDSDVFDLDIVGAGAQPTVISIACNRTVPLNRDLSLALNPFGIVSSMVDPSGNMTNVRYGQSASFPTDDLTFNWTQGANPDEVDAMSLTGVDLDFTAFPERDGDPLDVTLKMVFQDGGVLEFAVQEPVKSSSFNSCPSG